MPPRGKEKKENKRKKKEKKTKQPPQLITKKDQLFLLNNTNHWGFTVRKIFPFCLILHCFQQQQAAKVNGKQCDQYKHERVPVCLKK